MLIVNCKICSASEIFSVFAINSSWFISKSSEILYFACEKFLFELEYWKFIALVSDCTFKSKNFSEKTYCEKFPLASSSRLTTVNQVQISESSQNPSQTINPNLGQFGDNFSFLSLHWSVSFSFMFFMLSDGP